MFKKIALILLVAVGVWAAHAPIIKKSTGGLKYPAPADWVITQMFDVVKSTAKDTVTSLSTQTWGFSYINTCPLYITSTADSAGDSMRVYLDFQISANDTDWVNGTTFTYKYTAAATTYYFLNIRDSIKVIVPYMRVVKRVPTLAANDTLTVDLDILFRK